MAGLEGVDLTRPRITLRSDELLTVRDRLDREPYRSLLEGIQTTITSAPAADPAQRDDCVQGVNEGRERDKANAARAAALVYRLDRHVVAGALVTPTPVERLAYGDAAAAWLGAGCLQSRIGTDPDRDIATSHELLALAVAYDLLAGSGYPFEPGEAQQIEDDLATLATDYYRDYTQTIAGLFLVNNHGSKGAASLGVTAIVLAERPMTPGDPTTDPRRWLDRGLDVTDEVLRFTYGPGDGAYGEGAHYLRYSGYNLVPFLHAWHELHPAPWTTLDGVVVPDLWAHPAWTRMARWALDHTLPDGTLTSIDDSNVGERPHLGVFPADVPDAEHLAWGWLSTFSAGDGGSLDKRVDELVLFDDTIAAAPPDGSPTAFYLAGGSALLRSGWGTDDLLVTVAGEHGAAREFGRTREGTGQVWGAPHDHADPGALTMWWGGEQLLLDGGYINYPWSLQSMVNKPSDHSMILVDPPGATVRDESPMDPLTESTRPLWAPASVHPFFTTPGAPSPVDGDAQLGEALDTSFVDGVTVISRYGTGAGATVRRRVLTIQDRFAVVVDDIDSPTQRPITWVWHGNAGGTSGTDPAVPALSDEQRPPSGAGALDAQSVTAAGGVFVPDPRGGTWERGGVRLTIGQGMTSWDATSIVEGRHELPGKQLGSHVAQRKRATSAHPESLSILYPSPTTGLAPVLESSGVPDWYGAGSRVIDEAGDLQVIGWQGVKSVEHLPHEILTHQADVGGRTLEVRRRAGDQPLFVAVADQAGTLQTLWAEDVLSIELDGEELLSSPVPADLGWHLVDATTAEIVVDPLTGTAGGFPARAVEVGGLPFTPASVDGACGLDASGVVPVVRFGRDGVATLHADASGGRPSADAGPTRRVAVGAEVVLGTPAGLPLGPGCDPDDPQEQLTATWDLVAAPPGSDWDLDASDPDRPVLRADRAGVFIVELTVTDSTARTSRPVRLEVRAGPADGDDADSDLDGAFDTLDLDGDRDPHTFGDVPAGHKFSGAIEWASGGALAGGYADGSFKPAAPVSRQAMAALLWRAAGSPDPAAASPSFPDVGPSHPFRDAIVWMAQEGYVNGYADGTFRPTAPVSRQAMAALLERMAGALIDPAGVPLPPPGGDPGFSDVPPTHPFLAEISWLVGRGYASGYIDGTFRPTAPVSRQALVSVLQRALAWWATPEAWPAP